MDNSRGALEEHIRGPLEDGYREVPLRALAEACYVFSERAALGEIELGPDEALRVWAMVEKIRRDGGFPENLRM